MEKREIKELHSISLPAFSAPNGVLWSDDHKVSCVTGSALHIMEWKFHLNVKSKMTWLVVLVLTILSPSMVSSSNITKPVFGSVTDLLPAAFGDFNADELTDLFAIRHKGKTVEVFLAADQEPLLRPNKLVCSYDHEITSVVPGDFDGDTHMDVLVTTGNGKETKVFISWGGNDSLNCSMDIHFLEMIGQPLALDFDHNMIVDLFGIDKNGVRTVWLFNSNRTAPEPRVLNYTQEGAVINSLRNPHSHAFFDVNNDYVPDLYLSTTKGYEIWLQDRTGKFVFNQTIDNPPGVVIGQSLFVDLELEGSLQHIVPVCFDKNCQNTTLYVYYQDHWCNLNPNFKEASGKVWGFVQPNVEKMYINTMTLRAGDFNMDGYPDLLATLGHEGKYKAFLLENIARETMDSCDGLRRTFVVRWNALNPLNEDSSMAVFYDLYQDGVLDIILASQDRVQAFRNTLDYDANFVKVMVLGGKEQGTSLPGPRISYRTTTQEGSPRTAVSAQLPQSAHFALGLPYSIFGLGRTPNFVDTLNVGVGGQSREWTQIIPNSQMVVIPYPLHAPGSWRARLFVTPSKLILLSVAALTGTCCLIVAIIVGLYMKERREDRIEKLQEAHRFHFDAM